MAQVLKEDVRENIRIASIQEFKENGYEKASMRAIATNAGISVGNLYRYFSDKHSLFDNIVSTIYENINSNVHFEYKMLFLDVNLLEHMDLINRFISTRKGHRDELYILLEKSKGSKYEDIKPIMISKMEAAFMDTVIAEVNKDQEIVKGTLFAKAFSTSIVEGLTKIIVEAEEEEVFVQNVIQYIEFTFKSTIRTLIAIRDGKMNFRRISDEEKELYNNINCGHNR